MIEAILWRTPEKLCMGWRTALWTSSAQSSTHRCELGFSCPRAVQKKNLPSRPKIATNGTESTTESDPK